MEPIIRSAALKVPDDLTAPVALDRLTTLGVNGVLGFAHDDHRFVLPIAHYAQQMGSLPKPCTVVMLDQHSDALHPRNAETLQRMVDFRASGFEFEQFVEFVRDELAQLDDDWLVSGMEIGLFGDAVVFGVDDIAGRGLTEFEDHLGQEHRIWVNGGFPGDCLGFQGNLSDTARSYEVEPLWEILGWGASEGTFDFVKDESILFSIDLDVFVVDW